MCGQRIIKKEEIPICQALIFLSRNLVSNNEPICLQMQEGAASSEDFKDFLSFAENKKGFHPKTINLLVKNFGNFLKS